MQHFWKRWSAEYVKELLKFNKWNFSSRNLQVGDVVCVHEDGLVPTKWPLARITAVDDGLVGVVTLKTHKGSYKRPANKIALLLPHSHT